MNQKHEEQKDGSNQSRPGIGVRTPKIFMTCWNEKEHETLSPVRFSDFVFKPCPECGTTHKLSHRIDNGE